MYKTQYTGDNTARGPSPIIWSDCPWIEMIADPNKGRRLYDDFHFGGFQISDTGAGKYDTYIDTGVTFSGTNTDLIGECEVAGNDADNDEGIISTHNTIASISDTAGDDYPLWFECRIKKASIADNALSFFIGLGYDVGNGVTLAKADALVDDTGAIGAFASIGFSCLAAAGESVDCVYKEDADATTTTNLSAAHTLVADTYVKLGFKYSPAAPAAKRIAWFVNGAEQSTYVTATQIATSTFPDAEAMALCLCTKVGADAESKLQIDWWRFAQLTTV